MKCPDNVCPSCGDKLIHQHNRSINESSSSYGQHIHNDHGNEFYWADVDGIIYKLATGILRMVEHKPIGGTLRPSQIRILPLMAAALDVLVAEDVLHPDSGVFVVNSDPPHTHALVRRYRRDDDGNWIPGRSDDAVKLEGDRLRDFETGESVPELS